MVITHSYIGTVLGTARYSFYVLYEDYIDAQSGFVRNLEPSLERFARKIKHDGAVVKPFMGDIETTRTQILNKPWTERELSQIHKTPGFLVIDKDFADFDPRKHRWLYLNFGNRLEDRSASNQVAPGEYEDVLNRLADIVLDPNRDLFKEALPIMRKLKLEQVVEIFEARPEVFGFSVDLKRAAKLLLESFR